MFSFRRLPAYLSFRRQHELLLFILKQLWPVG